MASTASRLGSAELGGRRDAHIDAGGGEHGFCARDLSGEGEAGHSGHRVADLAQGVARHFRHGLHLAPCALRVSFRQSRSKIGLNRNQGESVAQQVVEITRDALALGHRRQGAHFVLGLEQALDCGAG